MAAGDDAQAAGERIEALLSALRSQAGPQVAATAEELVSCLVELYGAGLARITEIVGGDESGPKLMDKLVADPLVESLLLVHDLHPLDTSTRVRRAVEEVLPQLGSHAGDIEYLGLDDQGVLRLRLEQGGCSADTARDLIGKAVATAAPEAAGVAVERAQDPAFGVLRMEVVQDEEAGDEVVRREAGEQLAAGRALVDDLHHPLEPAAVELEQRAHQLLGGPPGLAVGDRAQLREQPLDPVADRAEISCRRRHPLSHGPAAPGSASGAAPGACRRPGTYGRRTAGRGRSCALSA